MLKKVGLWRGLASLLVAIMILAVFATAILMRYASTINNVLGVSTSIAVEIENPDGEQIDSEYYKSTYGELSAENLVTLENAAYEQNEKEAAEGAVLLKNDGNALPLASTERDVTMFGRATYAPLYRTTAACTRSDTENPELIVSLNQALINSGFNVNQDLYNAYAEGTGSTRLGFSYLFEEPISFYNSRQSLWQNNKDVAIVMLTRSAGEGQDMRIDQNEARDFKNEAVKVNNSLALQPKEADMLRLIAGEGFGKTIVLINTNYMMELDWLDDPQYGIDACLFVGTLGLKGFSGVADILTGEVNPSGKTVDTFAASSLSSPAIVNACGNTPQWANASTYQSSGVVADYYNETAYVSVQQESIYVGYKYYETRYADAMMGDTGAKSSVGSSFEGGWDYSREMCYPFGYGLSYTTFDYSIKDVVDNNDKTYTVTVNVKNTGSVAGKTPIQIYVNTPYGTYEKTNKIEKSFVQLVSFGKTDILQPGADEDYEIEVEKYLFASYDYTTTKGYVLTAGDYYFAVGSDCHDAANNVLAAKGYTSGLINVDGTAFIASTNKVNKFLTLNELDKTTFAQSKTGVQVTNQFDKMDINYWEGNSVKYLTRSDWSGTFPTAAASVSVIGTEMETLLQGDLYVKPADAPSTSEYAQGKDNNWEGVNKNIPFVAMKDADYEDAIWEEFLDQFSLADLVSMMGNDEGNKPIVTVVVPEKSGGDGCQGVGGNGKFFLKKYTNDATLWPCLYTSLLTCTWDKELIENRGTLMANEALYVNHAVIWTGGGNLHRTPYGGRQAEYYSEDANMCYIAGSIEMPAMEKVGILAGFKHFAGNDQETKREGLNVFYTEQGFREGALRGFEGGISKGEVKAVMQAFNRQGVVYSSSCYELNVTVLREEWGFKGHTITDASSGARNGYKSHYTTSVTNGTDMYCLDGGAVGGGVIAKSIQDNDDGNLLKYFRNATKNILYAMSRSAAINGLTSNTEIRPITPAWQMVVYVGMGVTIALAVAGIGMFVLSKILVAKGRRAKA